MIAVTIRGNLVVVFVKVQLGLKGQEVVRAQLGLKDLRDFRVFRVPLVIWDLRDLKVLRDLRVQLDRKVHKGLRVHTGPLVLPDHKALRGLLE